MRLYPAKENHSTSDRYQNETTKKVLKVQNLKTFSAYIKMHHYNTICE